MGDDTTGAAGGETGNAGPCPAFSPASIRTSPAGDPKAEATSSSDRPSSPAGFEKSGVFRHDIRGFLLGQAFLQPGLQLPQVFFSGHGILSYTVVVRTVGLIIHHYCFKHNS